MSVTTKNLNLKLKLIEISNERGTVLYQDIAGGVTLYLNKYNLNILSPGFIPQNITINIEVQNG